MAIIKLSSSKKSVQFIDENGNVFFTSVNYLLGLLNGKSPYGFIQLKRLPVPIAMTRYKPSEVWDPNGVLDGRTIENIEQKVDGHSPNLKKELEKKEAVKDKVVW